MYPSDDAFVGTISVLLGSLCVNAMVYSFSSPLKPATTFAVGLVMIIPMSIVSIAFALPTSMIGSETLCISEC